MSSIDTANAYPFRLDSATGKYDLRHWDDEYWRRLEYFLKETHDRNIIVQLEIWDTYDFYTRPHMRDTDGLTVWQRNPFNPRNNVNYTAQESGLYEDFRSTHGTLINPFFHTVLPLREPFDFNIRPVVLEYQQKFVDKLLSITFNYDHVLYVIDNETNADPKWPLYWSQYINKKASEKDKEIEVPEMWDTFDPTDGAVEGALIQDPSVHFFALRSSVSNTLYDPDNYTYLDISNHNFQVGEMHYKTGLYVWKEVQKSGMIRPVNNTKIYGADDIGWDSHTEGSERFWRNIFSGAASVRFHRPPHGLGHRDLAMAHIKSMRMLTDSIDMFSTYPDNDRLGDRSDNEGFCLSSNKGEYILYFPASGAVRMDIGRGNYELQWLHIRSSSWSEKLVMKLPATIRTPGDDQWALLIKKERD